MSQREAYAVPIAQYFGSVEDRYEHFHRHGDDFGLTDDGEYQAEERNFLNADRSIHNDIQECIRASNGDIIRFNANTNQFAIMTYNGIIRTYYKPIPRLSLTEPHLRRKGTHPLATNQFWNSASTRRQVSLPPEVYVLLAHIKLLPTAQNEFHTQFLWGCTKLYDRRGQKTTLEDIERICY